MAKTGIGKNTGLVKKNFSKVWGFLIGWIIFVSVCVFSHALSLCSVDVCISMNAKLHLTN